MEIRNIIKNANKVVSNGNDLLDSYAETETNREVAEIACTKLLPMFVICAMNYCVFTSYGGCNFPFYFFTSSLIVGFTSSLESQHAHDTILISNVQITFTSFIFDLFLF